ncbi:MAG TPA: hypothetical protein VGI82_00350 [Chitinophagaceae bacterium]
MEAGIILKSNALEILEKQLRQKAKKGQFGFVALGSATDAYMRKCLLGWESGIGR